MYLWFSNIQKYFECFSPSTSHLALDLIIEPFIDLLFFLFFCNSSKSGTSYSMESISFIKFDSLLSTDLFSYDETFIVSPLIFSNNTLKNWLIVEMLLWLYTGTAHLIFSLAIILFIFIKYSLSFNSELLISRLLPLSEFTDCNIKFKY